ncbi:MAG: DUF4089 domain-containing protein [Cytophagales bacterium]|nr:DUF4089 domain-containing protein [Rhizobacter sp.]
MTSTTEIDDYVRATARFLALPLEEAQVVRVAAHLARTQAMVASLQAVTLPPDVETAEIFCPAPFPPGDA